MKFQIACDFLTWILLLTLITGISSARSENVEDESTTVPEVTISQGTLQGITRLSRSNRSIHTFLGIPYGQPPIGSLRFSNPVAAEGWNATRNASQEGNFCIQFITYIGGYAGDEDCLYLNVFTPQLPTDSDTSLLPVMVFIPGGGFEGGSGDSSSYGPDYLLDADVLLVTMNYRVGPLGFFSTGDEVASGNWGLKDQVLALKWVQRNIAQFGGDPDRVTLFGHSAGGASVQLLALSNSTIGLFHQYISQSGAAFGFWVHRPRLEFANVALNLGNLLGCPTNSSSLLVECLREFNASDIVETRPKLYEWDAYPLFIWGPTNEPDIEGAVLTDSPTNLYNAGKIRDVPSITGIVQDEGIGFSPGPLPDSDTFGDFLENFDFALPAVCQYSDQLEDVTNLTLALQEYYFNNNLTTDRTQLWSSCVDLVSDAFFVYPVYNALDRQLALGKQTSFFYSFEYRGTYAAANYFADSLSNNDLLNTSVLHGDELAYLFSESTAPFEGMTETDIQMLETMVQLWTSFAINGTPTTSISNTTWLPFSSDGNYLRIGSGSDATLQIQYDFLPERMQFWNNVTGFTVEGSENAATVSSSLSLSLMFVFLIAYSATFLLTA